MRLFIGIDPDTIRSGVAAWNSDIKQLQVAAPMSFFELFDWLCGNKENIVLVRVEAGWRNQKSNFHSRGSQTKQAGERIAKNVGSNHEAGRKIVEMCKYLSIPCEEVLPMGKITREYFKSLTKLSEKNQDIIDAVMLVWEYK